MTVCTVPKCETILSRFNYSDRCYAHTNWKQVVKVAERVHNRTILGFGHGKVGPSSARFVSGGFPEGLDSHDLQALRSGSWLKGHKL